MFATRASTLVVRRAVPSAIRVSIFLEGMDEMG